MRRVGIRTPQVYPVIQQLELAPDRVDIVVNAVVAHESCTTVQAVAAFNYKFVPRREGEYRLAGTFV